MQSKAFLFFGTLMEKMVPSGVSPPKALCREVLLQEWQRAEVNLNIEVNDARRPVWVDMQDRMLKRPISYR